MRQYSGRFRRNDSDASSCSRWWLLRRKGHPLPGYDRIEFSGHQQREVAGLMEATRELGRPIAGSPIDIRARGTDNG
jgi:hypothetical protein